MSTTYQDLLNKSIKKMNKRRINWGGILIDIILNYNLDLKYIFELSENVENFIESGQELGKKGNIPLGNDIIYLLSEIKKLKSKVDSQL